VRSPVSGAGGRPHRSGYSRSKDHRDTCPKSCGNALLLIPTTSFFLAFEIVLSIERSALRMPEFGRPKRQSSTVAAHAVRATCGRLTPTSGSPGIAAWREVVVARLDLAKAPAE